jgi:hypothetical protein
MTVGKQIDRSGNLDIACSGVTTPTAAALLACRRMNPCSLASNLWTGNVYRDPNPKVVADAKIRQELNNMRYRSVVVTERGGPEVLQIVEQDLRPPSAGEARVKILATSVCLPDVQARYGHAPIAPKLPFVPGYAVVGVVDAMGQGATRAAVGDRVGALTNFGGYAECIYYCKCTTSGR